MYSFLPKLSQQLGQLAKMNKNPYINNQNPPFEPPEGPGNVYKNLLAGDKERFYRNYDNKWYVAGERDGQDWRDISKEGWNEMLNNMVKMNPAQNDEQYDNNEMGFDSRLYRQGNPEYKEISSITNASIPNQTAGLGMFNIPVTTNDMGGTGVLLSNNPFPKVNTPELDMLMGKAEIPYNMDYVPFASEEEMLRQTNPLPPDPLNPEPINIQTLDATGINNLAKNMPLPGAKQYPSFHGEYERMRQLAKDEAIVAEENKPKELPAFHGEYERAKEQAKKEYWQNYKPIEMPFTPFKGQIPNDIDIENLAKDMPLPPGNTPTNTTNPTNLLVQTPKNKFGLPEAYYLGNSLLNATALLNNMVQAEPPSIKMKVPYSERLRLDPTQYDAARGQLGEQSNAAYRLQRENISQASDLMKGVAAVTSGTQQNLAQIGMSQAAAEAAINQANQQISAQEQAGIAQTLNQEAITNWDIKDKFYKEKGNAITQALGALSQTAGQYTKYSTMKDLVQRQEEMSKSAAEINNQMQANLLEYEIAQSALESQEYGDFYKTQRTAEQQRIQKELLGDDKYKAFNEYHNGVIPSMSSYQYNIDSPESREKLQTINIAKRFQTEYPMGAKPDIKNYANDAEGYKKAVERYDQMSKVNEQYLTNPKYKAYEAEQEFWNEVISKFNESALRKSTAETYLKSRGLSTTSEIFQRLKAISDRGSQIVG